MTTVLRWFLLTLLLTLPLHAELGPVDPQYRQVAFYVSRFLQEEHFARRPIDEALAKEWVEAYLKDLDYNRMFFLQSDVDEFQKKFSPTIAADLKRGEISPALDIFKVFEKRLSDRMAWVSGRLKQPFDLTKDESYTPDRTKAAWPKDAADAGALWERRLKNEFLSEKLGWADKKTTDTPAQRLQKRYERFAKNVDEMDAAEVIEFYLTALARTYDPHSQYLSPDTLEDFVIGMKNSLFGIGAVLTVEDGYCKIKEIMPGGPADMDKRLKVNDRIVAVAQGKEEYADIVDMRLRNAVKLIRGPKGSEVRLKVIPADSDDSVRTEISLQRNEIKITNQRAKAQIIDLPASGTVPAMKVGVIALPSFYGDIDRKEGGESSTTTEDVRRLLEELKKAQVGGVVLDLRNNGGGLLSEAVLLTGLFIDRGPVVQVKDSRGRKQVLEDTDRGTAYDGPLVVLTNKMSASASEIAAGALQNYGRALVIGDKSTHGKGTVQTVQEIGRYLGGLTGGTPNAGAVKLTVQKFYLPNGHSTQMRGVIPDISLPTPNDYLELGEDRLPHALPWDEITGEKFAKDTVIATDLPQLIRRSKDRIAASPEFAELNKDIERLRQRLEHPEVSLVEKTRVKERLEDKDRIKLREAAIKKLALAGPQVVRLSFNADEGIKTTTGEEKEDKPATDDDEDGNLNKRLTGSEQFAADLHLQETLNILRDFIQMEKKPAVAGQVPPS
jgi:carboxyl-terminal processing protease